MTMNLLWATFEAPEIYKIELDRGEENIETNDFTGRITKEEICEAQQEAIFIQVDLAMTSTAREINQKLTGVWWVFNK